MTSIINRDEVWWNQAPLPPVKHECKVQTIGLLDNGEVVNRCACGAFRYYPGRWVDINSRRGKVAKKPSLWQRILRRIS